MCWPLVIGGFWMDNVLSGIQEKVGPLELIPPRGRGIVRSDQLIIHAGLCSGNSSDGLELCPARTQGFHVNIIIVLPLPHKKIKIKEKLNFLSEACFIYDRENSLNFCFHYMKLLVVFEL